MSGQSISWCAAHSARKPKHHHDRRAGMSVDLRLTGGTVATPAGNVTADVLVDSEKIVGLVHKSVPAEAERTVDVTGKLVLPGMIDVHVHTREPGFEHKEDI